MFLNIVYFYCFFFFIHIDLHQYLLKYDLKSNGAFASCLLTIECSLMFHLNLNIFCYSFLYSSNKKKVNFKFLSEIKFKQNKINKQIQELKLNMNRTKKLCQKNKSSDLNYQKSRGLHQYFQYNQHH